jgi:N-acetylglucosamine-6-phosphate deacetylase
VTTVLASSAVCPPGAPAPGWIAMDGGVITELGNGKPARDALDLGGALLTPAFVDLQCNGVGDVDFATTDAAGWSRARTVLARHGVGAFCPTFVTAPIDVYPTMLASAARARDDTASGQAAILGVHLEGPFLGDAPGAHPRDLIRRVDVEWIGRVVAPAGVVRMVTLAPEADPDLAGTRALAAAGITVALGHTRASFEHACQAAEEGASVVTHLFNGMGTLHHRDPGVAAAALTDERLTPTVIADLVHVHPAALRLAATCKPRLAAVSDAVGVGHGLVARDGAAWLPDGTLAGATTLLDGALGGLVASGVGIAQAVEAVTASPARLIGSREHGVLRPGARGDVVALDPDTMSVRRVWLAGSPVPLA